MPIIALCSAAPAPVVAHPHIFVDTGITLIVDDVGRLTHVEVKWAYDALYSLLITEDMGMDADGDAVLTPDEITRLTGFDMRWVEGFSGDLVGQIDGAPLALSGPIAPTADMREGRIITTHRRAVQDAPLVAGAVVSFKPYDETFYTAYDVTLGAKTRGAPCEVAIVTPEIDERLNQIKEQLATLGMDQDPVDVGLEGAIAAFATQVRFTCAR